jgi:REP element-mobilizing transposase RayT
MTYNLNKNKRKSIRLKNYNYKENGLYFITICIQNREHLLGKISHNRYMVYDAGLMVKSVWNNLSRYYRGVKSHDFVVMPNHIHGILELKNSDIDLSEIVRRFKTFTTHQYIKGVKNENWKPFYNKLWQRNYHEHIIRTDDSLDTLQRYILNNPLQWKDDIFYMD